MFKITESKHKIKTLKQGDTLWYIADGLTITPRAGFEIKKECPDDYKDVIFQSINCGWLVPVAYMRDDEYMWESLKQ